MGFFKNLFGKNEKTASSKLEPIIMQAIESLFPNEADQKQAIEYSIRYRNYQTSSDAHLLLLGLLSYSNGNIKKLLATEREAIRNYQFMIDEIGPRFPDMNAAEAWVKSITKPKI